MKISQNLFAKIGQYISDKFVSAYTLDFCFEDFEICRSVESFEILKEHDDTHELERVKKESSAPNFQKTGIKRERLVKRKTLLAFL